MTEETKQGDCALRFVPALSREDVDAIRAAFEDSEKSNHIVRPFDTHVLSRLYYGAIGHVIALEDELSTLRTSLQTMTEERDAIRDSSFCTKCGWSGVPLPLIGGERRITLDWQCGNSECGYLVPPPKSALIAALTEGKESAESRAQKATEAVANAAFDASCWGEDSPTADMLDALRRIHANLSEVLGEREG